LVAAVVVVATGCTHYAGPPARDPHACAELDSALAHSGLRDGLTMRGKTTIDVNQYRVRGRFELTLTPSGDLTFDMTSTTLLGGHREDAVMSFYADTLRVLDRERGRYYEGSEVDALVADGTGTALDLAALLRLVTTQTPRCERVADVWGTDAAAERLEGYLDARRFSLEIPVGGIARARWPLQVGESERWDTLEVTYTWREGRLSRFVVYVPERRWRIKLVAD
jgi:hypothetical protein